MEGRAPNATAFSGRRARSPVASAAPGVTVVGDRRVAVRVWAPNASQVEIRFVSPEERRVRLSATGGGYHEATIDQVPVGARYLFRLDDRDGLPDPASRHQPEGVHGPSAVVDPEFEWHDDRWRNMQLEDYALYELHVGTFTPEGTFDAVARHLPALRDLGVTAIEVMPVAQFPGARNWGYDGTYPYAVQESYGGPAGLRRLVDACHTAGLAFVLDVVYNHLGPEGNYLGGFGPYFTDRYRTPWGPAVNFDGPDSDAVRDFFVENAVYWVRDFHVDALRLDAVAAMFDVSARHILREVAEEVEGIASEFAKPVYLIAESDLNDPRIVSDPEIGGHGMHAQWNDDFHHALHVALTGERTGYYADYNGIGDLARSVNQTFVYTGQYSQYRRRRFGASASHLPPGRFVAFAQNHDQVGNRRLGDRLSGKVSFEASKLAASVLLLSPFIPLLWMGEEYGERAPFLYFVSHSDPELVAAVRKGRGEEFADFAWQGPPPDPQDEETFLKSRLDWSQSEAEPGRTLVEYYRTLLAMRREHPAFGRDGRRRMAAEAIDSASAVIVRVGASAPRAVVVHHFGSSSKELTVGGLAGRWRAAFDSADSRWRGPGSLAGQVLQALAGARGIRLPLQPFSSIVIEPAAPEREE